MKRRLLLGLAACSIYAQTATKQQETVVVTGSFETIPLEEADRSVRVLPLRNLRLTSNTFADMLKLDSSLDLRQRAPNGLQGDLSIRGGGFGQTLILLDGLRLNDVQSGHHNLDVPVPMESIAQIEILKGSGSTLYGSDAVGGVVNFVSKPPESSEIKVRTAFGNFGTNQQRVALGYARSRLTEYVSASRDFSSGFIPNRDYRNLSLASTTHWLTSLGSTDLTLAANDRPFGAEQFYGNYNSWERTRTWFASIRQSFGEQTDVAFAFRRHTDLFVLYRDRPQVFTNRHAVDGYQLAIRRRNDLWRNARLHYGVEAYRDSIASNNLGFHDRARSAAYVSLDVRALRKASFSVGVRDEIWGSANHELSPSVSAGLWLSPQWKLRGSASHAFRLPTYTDLYYHDPANVGSPGLRPERAWSYEGGVDWHASAKMTAELTVFQRRERDGIDYVRLFANDIWRATNFQSLRFTGMESVLRFKVAPANDVELSYAGLRSRQDTLGSLESKYVFNYPVHQALVAWHVVAPKGIALRTRIGALQRFSRDPYAVWDAFASSTRGRLRPFLQFTNLTSTRYEEIPGVAMPGRAVIGGLEWAVFGGR